MRFIGDKYQGGDTADALARGQEAGDALVAPLRQALEDNTLDLTIKQDLLKWSDPVLKALFYEFFMIDTEDWARLLKHVDIQEDQKKILLKLAEWLKAAGAVIPLSILEIEKQFFEEIVTARDSAFLLKLMSAVGERNEMFFSKVKDLILTKGKKGNLFFGEASWDETPDGQVAKNFAKAFPESMRDSSSLGTYERMWGRLTDEKVDSIFGELKLKLLNSDMSEEEKRSFIKAFIWASSVGMFLNRHSAQYSSEEERIKSAETLAESSDENIAKIYEEVVVMAKKHYGNFYLGINGDEIPTEKEFECLGISKAELFNRATIITTVITKGLKIAKAGIFIPKRESIDKLESVIDQSEAVNIALFSAVIDALKKPEDLNENQLSRAYEVIRKCLFAECVKKFPRLRNLHLYHASTLRRTKEGQKLFAEYLEEFSQAADVAANFTRMHNVAEKEQLAENLVFSEANMAKHPHLLTGLMEELVKPNAFGFYGACKFLAKLVDQGREDVVKALIATVFPDAARLERPEGALALCYILENLPMDKRGAFFIKVMKGKSLQVTDESATIMATRMEQFNDYLGKAKYRPVVTQSSADLGLGLSGSLQPRDVALLIQQIAPHKSISMLAQGHKMPNMKVDSPLDAMITECRITPSRETKRFPDSLACLVTLKSANGTVMHYKINEHNRLMFRVIKPGQPDQELDMEKLMKEVDNEMQFQEIFYYILKRLEFIYLKKKSSDRPAANDASEDGEDVAGTNKPNEDEETEPTKPAGTEIEPTAAARVETDHVLDITEDDEEKGEKMEASDLNEKEVKAEEKAALKLANRKIKANQVLAKKLLELYFSKDGLPEKMPEELANLLVYRKVPIDRTDYFEAINTETFYLLLRKGAVELPDYWVRNKRVHTQALPYVHFGPSRKVIRKLDGDNVLEEERVILNEKIVRVRQGSPNVDRNDTQKQLFVESGEGQLLDLKKRPKILSIKTDATEENLALFDKLAGRSKEQIERIIEARINRALDKNIEAARVKYPAVDGQPNEKFLQIQERIHRLARVLKETEMKLEVELLGKYIKLEEPVGPEELTGETRKKITLQFPQVFPFEQTLNRGEFITLERLLDEMTKAK